MSSLVSLIPEGAILLDVEAEDDHSLIALMADALVSAGKVGPGYSARCIEREVTNPTGLVTAGGSIAIPHAELAEGDTAAIAVVRPSRPVTFRAMADEGTVDVEVAFLLALPAGEPHLEALSEVIDLGQDPDRMTAIRAAKQPDDVRRAMERGAT